MKSPKILVVDYGVGNLLSVRRGLEHCGAQVVYSSDPREIISASRVVLPGVGAFGRGMQELNRLNLIESLVEVANKGIPLLGICLGMQILMEESEEFGISYGLGLISGKVISIPQKDVLGLAHKIPHIGWNELYRHEEQISWNGTLLENISSGESVYFTHSFMAEVTDRKYQLAHCEYGGRMISAVIQKDNITGCQFHPEKSGEVGLKILKKFILD